MTEALCAIMGLSIAWLGFAYVGYPLALLALPPRPLRRGVAPDSDFAPSVSVLIAAHNAEAEIGAKIEATLALDCPGPVEIIVASDASTDRTAEVAESFCDRGVVVVRCPRRGGKEAAQAAAIQRAHGDILVFTDVTARLEADALCRIVEPFADAGVGCVSSEDRVVSGDGEGLYVRFEMLLRRLESERSSLVGLSGSFFAARRELCRPWPADLASDFRIALEAARRGLRAVAEPGARAEFGATEGGIAEWRRKVRTVRRGLSVLSTYRGLLHPRHGRVALSVLGHKLARFTAPFAAIALLAANVPLAALSPAAAWLLALQLVFYGTGLLALAVPRVNGLLPARLAGFFVLVNASMLVAWVYHLAGHRVVVWEPTVR